jgi:hypothetical protein
MKIVAIANLILAIISSLPVYHISMQMDEQLERLSVTFSLQRFALA